MKKNTLYFLTLMFGVCLLLFACRKEIEYFVNDRVEAPSTQLENAKIWRMRHLNKNSRSEALKPFWDNSWIIKSSNGTLIVVPAPEKKVDNKQFSVRRFFIFSLSGNMISDGGIVELTGDSYDVEKNVDHLLKNIGKSTIHNFNGAIITYDINYSYLESTTYQNGSSNATETRLINSAVGDFDKREPKVYLRSSSCDAVSPIFIGFPASLCANGWVTFLKHTVTDADGCLISETYTFVNISCPSTGGGGSAGGSGSGGGGGNPPYGEGGWTPGSGSSTGITAAQLAAALLINDKVPKIEDISKYVKCFNDGKAATGYTMTIYVDQPLPGSSVPFLALSQQELDSPIPRGILIQAATSNYDVGHTFVCFEKNNTDGTSVRQTLGFYPNPNGSSLNSKGVIKDDSGHHYDVAYKINVNALNFDKAFTELVSDFSTAQYNLLNYNCTSAAISWMNAAGAGLPNKPITFLKDAPSEYGQFLRGKTGSNTVAGSAINGKGPCQ